MDLDQIIRKDMVTFNLTNGLVLNGDKWWTAIHIVDSISCNIRLCSFRSYCSCYQEGTHQGDICNCKTATSQTTKITKKKKKSKTVNKESYQSHTHLNN